MTSSPRPVLAFLLALGALSTVACAAPAAGDTLAEGEAPASAADAETAIAISGSATSTRASERPALPSDLDATAAAPIAGSFLVGAATYDVVSFDLGLDASVPLGTTAGGAMATKPVISFALRVRPRGDAKPLGGRVLAPSSRTSAKLLLNEGAKPTPFATFQNIRVTRARFEASASGTDELVELSASAVLLERGAAKVSIDLATNVTTCLDACPCGTPSQPTALGPFTQTAQASWPIAPENDRIDAVSVVVSKIAPTTGATGTGDIQPAKPVLEDFATTGKLDEAGVCAMFQAATGAFAKNLVVEVASPLSGILQKPVTETKWEACMAGAREVHVASSDAGATQTIRSVALGIIRTDLSYDGLSGKVLGGTTNGWSFFRSAAIASCGQVLSGS